MAGNLTPKQQAFVNEYLIDLNATQAAIRAGYSEKNAHKIGPELIGKTRIAEALREAQKERQERTFITQDRVIREIAENAFKPASDAPDSDFKHASKAKYLDMLCKHLGAYDGANRETEEKVEIIIDV